MIYENNKDNQNDNNNKFIIVKSLEEISIYNLKTKQFKFKISLKIKEGKKAEENYYLDKNYFPLDKLEIVNKIYYNKINSKIEISDNIILIKSNIEDYLKIAKKIFFLLNISLI